MTTVLPRPDLTRWNRAGLSRFAYVDGNAPAFLELLRAALGRRFGGDGDTLWQILHSAPATERPREQLRRVEAQYNADRRDIGWEILRVFARACHILTGHIEAYANEGFLGTATQWDHVRRLVEMLDYHPAPPASAFTTVTLVAKPGAQGKVSKGLQMKYTPASGSAVTFETLEDVVIDAALNELRPIGYGRNPNALSGSVLTFDGAIKHLKTGEPVMLEDDRSPGILRAYIIQGVRENPERTEVTVRPSLWQGFVAGHTTVHVQPEDRLDLQGPAAEQGTVGRVLHLAVPPTGLQARDIAYISDGRNAYYRRVVAVRDRIVVFDEDVGALNFVYATVTKAQIVAVNRLTERIAGANGSIRVVRVAGDYSRLTAATIADLCIGAGKRTRIVAYTVSSAAFIPGEQKNNDVNAAYTMLHVSVPAGETCTLVNPQSLWIPPIGGGWPVDRFVPRSHAALPQSVTTSKPKKAAGGDLAAIVRRNQIAWARLASVELNATGGANVRVDGAWQDRGGSDLYLSDTQVYAHFKQQLHVSGWQTNDSLQIGNVLTVRDAPDTLHKGMRLLLEANGQNAVQAIVLDVQGNDITLSQAMPDGATVDTLVARGNVVGVGHGESKTERVLGGGLASASNQAFVLPVAHISFIADSTQATGVRADLAVRIAGAEWKQVSTLTDSGPADPHYVVRMTEDGFIRIAFGDGTNGRRLPTGQNNVRVSYREGMGVAGNILPHSLTKPLKPHALVAAVRQPNAAVGGNDMETVDSLRENAPASLLTLERAVSLDDFGHLAGSHSSVWQARAFAQPTGFQQREQIKVVVVPAHGGTLGELRPTLENFLLGHGVPGVAITVVDFQQQTFDVGVTLTVDEAAFVADDVKRDVERALRETFALNRRHLGQDVFLSEVYKVVENVTGVAHSTIVIDGDKDTRRVLTPDDAVRVLGLSTVQVERETLTVGQSSGATSAPFPPPPAPSPTRRIGQEDTIVLDGVGAVYAGRLAAAGIRTVRDLVAVDPDRIAIAMPQRKLWEAIAKAQRLLETEVDANVARHVVDRTLIEIAMMTPAALAAVTGATPQAATQLRELVRGLQVSLDETAFGTLRLRELLPR